MVKSSGAGGALKALSNKMKSKGLQKLKWYCQLCEKQCRDENGEYMIYCVVFVLIMMLMFNCFNDD